MSEQPLRPSRLDLTDMPRDKQRALGGLRGALCASFNYCKRYPTKLKILKETLAYVHNRIVQFEKDQATFEESRRKALAERAEAEAKTALDKKAAEEGIELDARKSLEDMEKDYAAAIAVTQQKEPQKVTK